MNKRIQELAEQAGFIPDAFLAKFAELVVGECLSILDDEDTGNEDSRGVRLAILRIKEHFGVQQ